MKLPKRKVCRSCRGYFTPKRSTLEVCCSPLCATEYARKSDPERLNAYVRRARALAKREGREKLRSRSDWLKLAQAAFNAYIRERDKGKPCISCGRLTNAKQNAGHYRSVGAAPQLRFNEDNCHKQCEHCNSWKSGNQAEYRVRLIERIGLVRVENLESSNGVLRLSIDDIKALTSLYRAKLRELVKGKAA